MVTEAAIWAALAEVADPEIPPVSIVDMGMVSRVCVDEAAGSVQVEITPTFVGCPALELIRRQVEDRVRREEGVARVAVTFVFDSPWSSDRITPQGRERLQSFGIAPPAVTGSAFVSLVEAPPCPYCGSADTHMENLFGPTACRSIFYCDACRQPFEGMKTV